MSNRVIPKPKIDADGLYDLMGRHRVSIRELGRKGHTGYSESQIRKYLKNKTMPWDMIMAICDEMNVAYGVRMRESEVCYVVFDELENIQHVEEGMNPEIEYWIPMKSGDPMMGYPRFCERVKGGYDPT